MWQSILTRIPLSLESAPQGQDQSIRPRCGHFISRTNSNLCPVAAVLGYMAVCPQVQGLLLVHDGSPLTRDQFVRLVRNALRVAGIDNSAYASHNFKIGTATAAAAAGVPAHFIKMLGRWESNAYQVYLRTPRESLASVSQLIAE